VHSDGRASGAAALGGGVQGAAKWAENIYINTKSDFLRPKDFKLPNHINGNYFFLLQNFC
jgi:hypothetical protein